MPQMSPMDWFILSIFFMFIYFLSFLMIYFMFNLNMKNISLDFKKLNLTNFYLSW